MKFNIGDRVIVRSNENEPLVQGVITDYMHGHPIIRVDGQPMLVMSHIRPYSRDLWHFLQKMKPIEQWNYLVPHCQIKDIDKAPPKMRISKRG